jgi:hypothetical protein
VATWSLGNHLSICLKTRENQEKPVSRWQDLPNTDFEPAVRHLKEKHQYPQYNKYTTQYNTKYNKYPVQQMYRAINTPYNKYREDDHKKYKTAITIHAIQLTTMHTRTIKLT